MAENSLDLCCIFPLKKCKINEIFAGKFKLTCLNEGIILCSEDVQTGRSWISAIREAIDMHIEIRKTIRKDSSKRLPMRKKQAKKFEKFEEELMSPTEKKNVSSMFLWVGKFQQHSLYFRTFPRRSSTARTPASLISTKLARTAAPLVAFKRRPNGS